jgi:hypothetical protein
MSAQNERMLKRPYSNLSCNSDINKLTGKWFSPAFLSHKFGVAKLTNNNHVYVRPSVINKSLFLKPCKWQMYPGFWLKMRPSNPLI